MCKICDFNNPFDDQCHEIIDMNSDLGVLGNLNTVLYLTVSYERNNEGDPKKTKYELSIYNGHYKFDNQKDIKINYCPFCGRKLESE